MNAETPPSPDVVTAQPGRWVDAMWRGVRSRCPRCGQRGLLDGFLTVRSHCSHCELPFDEYRADDAPPYFTIFIVGHIVVPCVLISERWMAPALWIQAAIWVPFTLLLTLLLLPRVKGAVIGWQWAAGIKGS